ncbi:hypothetical protein EYR41_011574 [Orbilia oligospora]|uniref:Uncharacterized protein n=1 Tax=Orbilia oligospora TaxID=2813651 RepID=A0A7C8K1Y8_ORBOL|nr:hypothetical protein TWF751_000608 [Orbilia oligospora]TGJ63677.1 hypothetical protein EYR41_011574 [Orbilia oligospora]
MRDYSAMIITGSLATEEAPALWLISQPNMNMTFNFIIQYEFEMHAHPINEMSTIAVKSLEISGKRKGGPVRKAIGMQKRQPSFSLTSESRSTGSSEFELRYSGPKRA